MVIGVTNIIPFFGQYIGIIPSAILVFIASPTKGILFLILIIILMQVDGNIIGPKNFREIPLDWEVSGSYFSILVFGSLFGIIGMICAVPVFAIVYRLVKRWCEKRLIQKGKNPKTENYRKEIVRKKKKEREEGGKIDMSDYMRGYDNRNRRRRAAYSSSGRSAYKRRRKNRRGRSRLFFYLTRGGVIVAAILLVAFGVRAALGLVGEAGDSKEPAKTAGSAVTGAAVSASAVTPVPGGVAEAAAKVPEISEQIVPEPTKAPRSKAVALTFDDGPSTMYTNTILDVLEKNNAHATFFVVGQRVEGAEDILKRELSLGCEIGSHSWDHANLSLLTKSKLNKQNKKTIDAVKKATGYTIQTIRPPYGAISQTMRKKLKMPMILWSVDSLDWKSRDAKKVFKKIKKEVSDGDIILDI